MKNKNSDVPFWNITMEYQHTLQKTCRVFRNCLCTPNLEDCVKGAPVIHPDYIIIELSFN